MTDRGRKSAHLLAVAVILLAFVDVQFGMMFRGVTDRLAPSGRERLDETRPSEKVHARLTPPYRLVQMGVPRSGSTFQKTLLDVVLRALELAGVETMYNNAYLGYQSDPFKWMDEAGLTQNESFLIKTHNFSSVKLYQERNVSLFVSATAGTVLSNDPDWISLRSTAEHIQTSDNMLICSSCEIDHYRSIFGMDEKTLQLVKRYMSLYEKTRRCCGLEMSKYNVWRLNGCDVSKYKSLPSYPDCEHENMTQVEVDVQALGLLSPQRIGDCARSIETISHGVGFGGEPFPGCNATYFGLSDAKVDRSFH